MHVLVQYCSEKKSQELTTESEGGERVQCGVVYNILISYLSGPGFNF